MVKVGPNEKPDVLIIFNDRVRFIFQLLIIGVYRKVTKSVRPFDFFNTNPNRSFLTIHQIYYSSAPVVYMARQLLLANRARPCQSGFWQRKTSSQKLEVRSNAKNALPKRQTSQKWHIFWRTPNSRDAGHLSIHTICQSNIGGSLLANALVLIINWKFVSVLLLFQF